MRVGADERIGIGLGHAVDGLREHDAREVLDVDLMHDASVGRNDLEVVEGTLAPAEKRVALPVARELELGVQGKRVLPAEVVHLNRVIDDELDRLERVHAIRIPLQLDDRVPHRRQIDDTGHAREVLQQHASRHERDFLLDGPGRVPLSERPDVIRLDEPTVLAPQQVLEQHLHRIRKPRDPWKARLFECGQAVNLHRLSANANLGARVETVEGSHDPSMIPRRYPLSVFTRAPLQEPTGREVDLKREDDAP